MPSRRLVAVWVVAALAATGLSSAAVGLATAQVTTPVAVGALADVAPASGAAPPSAAVDEPVASTERASEDVAVAPPPADPGPDDSAAPVAPGVEAAPAAGGDPSRPTATDEWSDEPDDAPVTPDAPGDDEGDDDEEPSQATTSAGSLDETRTASAVGGTVRFHFSPGEVEVVFATPAPGFGVDVDRDGPTDVRVTFESDDHESRVDAELEDGVPRVRVREEAEDD